MTWGRRVLVKKYLGAVAFNNTTRLAFGKRFANSEGIIDEQGQEFKAIVANGLKLGTSLAMAEHIQWLRRLLGSNVHVNVWAEARDPAVWKKPSEFRPEKFLEDDVDMKGQDFRLPFVAGRRVCPGAQLCINLVTSMLGHLLHHFHWAPPSEMTAEDMDMGESSGLVTYMKTPLQAVPTSRLPAELYKRVAFEVTCRLYEEKEKILAFVLLE